LQELVAAAATEKYNQTNDNDPATTVIIE